MMRLLKDLWFGDRSEGFDFGCPRAFLFHRWESIACATNDGPRVCLNCGKAKG